MPKACIAESWRQLVGSRSRDSGPGVMASLIAGFLSMVFMPSAQAEIGVAAQALKVDGGSFRCIRQMTPIRHFYVDNLLGHRDATLAAANAKSGAIYPEGSVVQLVPTEAMVKREKGFNPATGDWEFFELEVSASGSVIRKRGFAEVNNRFGKNCFACHVPARVPWDFVCETGHGCDPIPITRAMTGALQRTDPRCAPATPQPGDSTALWKLKALVLAGIVIDWVRNLF